MQRTSNKIIAKNNNFYFAKIQGTPAKYLNLENLFNVSLGPEVAPSLT